VWTLFVPARRRPPFLAHRTPPPRPSRQLRTAVPEPASPPGSPPVPVLPARPVPVAALIGFPSRDHHQVPQARRYLLLAPWADVGLAGLIRVDDPHVDVGVRIGLSITCAAVVSAHKVILVLPPGPVGRPRSRI
jgi:hypothetical protein